MDNRRKLAVTAIALTVCAGAALWLNPWSAPTPTEPAKTAADSATGELVVSQVQAQEIGIRLTPAVAAGEAPLVDLPAMIAPPPNARVAVAATLPGVVTRTLVVEGDTVRRGQALAIIASRDVLSLHADLARASSRLGVAQTNARRLSQLDREGIIAGARADEARALAAEARTDVSEKSRMLQLVNGHGASGTYTLSAPIAGRVTTAGIRAGTPVDGSTAPYVIDAIDRYEVEAQLPERLIGQARPGMSIRLGDLRGTVTAVGSTIDPATRSVMLKATLPPGANVVSGRATTVSLFGPAPAGAVTVPSAAITKLNGHDAVFVPVDRGFRVRQVTAAGSSGGMTLVLSGLRPGEQVVVAGTSALKSLAQAN